MVALGGAGRAGQGRCGSQNGVSVTRGRKQAASPRALTGPGRSGNGLRLVLFIVRKAVVAALGTATYWNVVFISTSPTITLWASLLLAMDAGRSTSNMADVADSCTRI